MIIRGNCLEELRKLPSDSVDICLTSPPFWHEWWKTNPPITWLDGWTGHLGAEPTISQYVDHLVSIFDEVKRVLSDHHGSCWIVLRDTVQNHSLDLYPERFAIAMKNNGWILRSHILLRYRKDTQCYDVFFFTKHEEYPYSINYPSIRDLVEGSNDGQLFGFSVIKNHCPTNGVILDPFTGRGTTALAAVLTGRRFIGFEINEERRQIALKRMETKEWVY